jgi:hypothetical protein
MSLILELYLTELYLTELYLTELYLTELYLTELYLTELARGFDSRYCFWNFSSLQSFRRQYSPRGDSASNRNENQGHLIGLKTAGA